MKLMISLNDMKKVIISALMILLVASCASKNKNDSLSETNPYTLYQQGLDALRNNSYKTAAEYFEQIEREHPASELAPESQIRRAYSYYLNENYNEAIFTVNDFIKQYTGHKDLAYMYYLKALSYYDQIVDIGRDQQMAELAINALTDLIHRFPETKYAQDAKIKLEFAYNSLAGKEMEVGRFYLKNDQISSAINRFKTVIEKYDRSIFIEEALYRMVEIYYFMGIEKEATKYAATLGYNYPHSKWYKKAYALISNQQTASESGWKEYIKKIW